MLTLRTFSTLALIATALSCSAEEQDPTPADPSAVRQLPESVRADLGPVVNGNNAFALDLYRQLKSEPGNLFFSPFSISTAFAMVQGGARGQTATEIADVFHFTVAGERLHPVYREVLKSIDRGAGLEGYQLSVANRLWGQEGFTFRDEYLALTREEYGAELEKTNFQQDPEAARQKVNGWVEDRTHDRITNLFPQGSINTDTRLVLANAIYFKGRWQEEFDPDATSDQAFQVAPDQSVTVPLMHKEDEFNFGGAEDVQILQLPYRGKDLAMLVLLPTAADGLPALEEGLTVERLAALKQSLHPGKVMVWLPRFTMTSMFSLNGTLSEMGMPTAFTDLADLSGMNGDGGLFIQSALHKAFVNVNEEGTEAAAATGVGVGVTSAPPTFRADHPFLFLIVDNITGSILFMGRVVNPTAQSQG